MMKTLLALLLCIPALAQAENPEDHSAHSGAHTHGTASLQIVLEGDNLSLEIRSPAANLIGFEHKANSTEQIAAVQHAQTVLAAADSVFRFSNGECKPVESSWDFSAVQTDKEKHDSDGNDDHIESPGIEHQEHGSEHRDLVGHYRYQCSTPDALESFSVTLFDAFSGVQALQVEWIVHGRQGAVTLDRDNNQISFR